MWTMEFVLCDWRKIPKVRDIGSHKFTKPKKPMDNTSNRKRVRGEVIGQSHEESKPQCLSEPPATPVFVPEAQSANVSHQSGVADDLCPEGKRQKILSGQSCTSNEICQNCGKNFKRILMHLNFNKECSDKYGDAQISAIRQRNNAQKRKKYNSINRDKIVEKQRIYNSINKDKIVQNQRLYDNVHKNEKNVKQRLYDKSHNAQIVQKQRLYDNVNKNLIYEKQKASYKKNNQQVQLKRLIQRVITSTDMTEKERLKKFWDATKYGPIFACICCHRMMFINQVLQVNIESLKTSCNAKSDKLFEKSISIPIADKFKVLNNYYLCENCNLYLIKRGKIPPMSALNGLQLDPIPPVLQLSDIEETLISQNILFLKIFELPTSRWKASINKIVNVPIGDDQASAFYVKT